MLAQIRSIFAHSWVARIGAAILAVAFGAWGIQGALFGPSGGGIGGADDVATVDGQSITATDFNDAYERALTDAAGAMSRESGAPADPATLPPPIRREVAASTLQRLQAEAAITANARRMGLVVPDDALRQAIFAIPAFKGPDGQFDRQRFNQVLASNGLTEARVLELERREMLSRGLIEPVRAGAVALPAVVKTLFDYGAEQRQLAIALVRDDAQAVPPTPDEATLRRWYANHQAAFTVPERRHIRAVVLSPDTVGRTIDIPESAVRTAYDAERATVMKPERRSVSIVTVPDRSRADAIASFWRGGGAFATVEAMASAAKGSAVQLADAAENELPSAALGQAVFTAPPDAVTGPIAEAGGNGGDWAVLEVTRITPASGTYAAEHDRLRDQLAATRAGEGLADRVDKLEDAIAGGGLDRIPDDLGAEAASGTLDAAGRTADGDPAPIPGSAALRQAVIAAAFAARPGAAPSLQPGPDHGYYAVAVDSVTPAHPEPFDTARPAVLAAVLAAARDRETNAAATAVYTAANAAHALAGPAAAAGLAVATPPPFRRAGAAPGIPAALQTVAFGLHTGDATMVAVPGGYAVAVLTAVIHPPEAADPAARDRLRAEVLQSVSDDLEVSYAEYLTRTARIRVNEAMLGRIAGAGGS